MKNDFIALISTSMDLMRLQLPNKLSQSVDAMINILALGPSIVENYFVVRHRIVTGAREVPFEETSNLPEAA